MSFNVQRISAEPVPASATQHMVRARDGVRLATDVYLPDDTTPMAAVLVRLPYDKNSRYVFFEAIAKHFTARGYALVVQDVRGKFRSEGPTVGWVHEANDGFDTIEWITHQPWSDGVVGMFGDSYYGFTQWAAVSSGHPALRAIVPRVTSANLRQPELPTSDVRDVEWLVQGDYLSHYWLDHDIYDFELDWSRRPLIDVFEAAFAELGTRSATFDLSIPRQVPVPIFPHGHPFDAKPLPVLHSVGWFDNLTIVSMRDYMTLRAKPGWAPLQYLSADSVDHENYHLSLTPITEANDHDVTDTALARLLPLYVGPALNFFDVFLKGLRGPEAIPRVQWHLGHDGYHESECWPPPAARVQRLLLGDLESATSSEGRLTSSSAPADGTIDWVHDAGNLVPSAVENSFAFLHSYPDESSTAQRSDVLTFLGEPAEEPLDLAGPADVWVHIKSTAPSTDVFAKLFDVSPDGATRMIMRGQSHLSFPAGDEPVRIELGHTGYRVRRGHRLRLNLASSDFPEYVPHPGTGENPWLAVDTKPSRQTLTTRADSPAALTLTVLDGRGGTQAAVR
jgi:hypothetical protein